MADSDYSCACDAMDRDRWTEIIGLFEDVSIYQTWSWGASLWGRRNLSHLVLQKGDDIVAAAQVWLMRLPVFNYGIAYLKWGPLTHVHDQGAVAQDEKAMIKALKEEYVKKRGLLLRLMPNVFFGMNEPSQSILESEGFTPRPGYQPGKTILMDLTSSGEPIDRTVSRNWLPSLKRARKAKVQVIEGTGDDLFEKFMYVYRKMVERKRFAELLNPADVRTIQNELPGNLKMRIMIGELNGTPVAGLISSMLGSTAVDILRASAGEGLTTGASSLLHCRMIERMRADGCRQYDLTGINPDGAPGTYQYKKGLAGKLGHVVTLHEHEACASATSLFMTRCGDVLRGRLRNPLKRLVAFNSR